MSKRTGNNKFLKEYNESIILDLIRINKALSKAELSKLTGLSATATGAITAGLIEKGYIYETGIGESRGGRRPVLLELKPDSFYSIGIDIDYDFINLVLLDITGITVCEKVIKMPNQSDFASVIKRAEDAAAEMLDNYLNDYSQLLGIGFSIPGLVDIKTRDIVLAPNLGWENSNVYSALIRFKEVPVFVENEAMASAICENWLGQCQNEDNFVCINVKSGIGAGIYTGGRPYRGASGTAGEVGHILVDENGPKCGCGSYGCLETVASSKSIVDKAKRLVKQGTVSTLNSLENADEMTISDVVAAASSGDEAARTVIIEAARYMGIAVSNIVNTINPSKIVLGKEFLKYADMAIDTIKGVVSCKALGTPASRVEIVASEIGEKASAMGAAIIPLKALFKYN